MNSTPAPPFKSTGSDYPLGGRLIGPAWRAAWQVLNVEGSRWVPLDALRVSMCLAAPGMHPKTAQGLMSKARQAGIVEARLRKFGAPPRRRAEYRLRR